MSRAQDFDEPQADQETKYDKRKLPKSMNRGPWRYVHNSLGWEVAFIEADDADRGDPDNWELLPVLSRIEGIGGANGVTYDRETDRWNFQAAASAHAQLGNLVLEPNDTRLGKYKNYASKFYDTQNGKRYVEPGEKFTLMPNGQVFPRSDMGAYQDFLRFLKKNGLIEPMEASVFNAMVNTIKFRIGQLQRHGDKRQHSIKKAEQDLVILRACWKRECAKHAGQAVEFEEPQIHMELEEDDGTPAASTPSRVTQVDQPSTLADDEPEGNVTAAARPGKPQPKRSR